MLVVHGGQMDSGDGQIFLSSPLLRGQTGEPKMPSLSWVGGSEA